MTEKNSVREMLVAEILSIMEMDPAPGSPELMRLEELTERGETYECDACLELMKKGFGHA